MGILLKAYIVKAFDKYILGRVPISFVVAL